MAILPPGGAGCRQVAVRGHLLCSQHDHRVNLGRPARRQPAGHQGYREQEGRDAQERDGFRPAETRQQSSEEATENNGSSHADDDSERREPEPVFEHEGKHFGRLCPERQPNPKFTRSLGHGSRYHTVKPDRGQHQAQPGETAQELPNEQDIALSSGNMSALANLTGTNTGDQTVPAL